ncbi:hypothetical protein NFI96_029395 [Prochilodus magdalenae]|nr:hypothetical protein NFI96_029395 [Prochilodus magdalenae]
MTLPEFADPFRYEDGTYEGAVTNVEICKQNLALSKEGFKYPPEPKVAPRTSVYSKYEVQLGSQNILICYITGFYPPEVKVSWTRNDVKVTNKATLSRYYLNNDGTFKLVSHLSFTPEQGDTYTCTVEHTALSGPLTKIWGVEDTLPNVGPSVLLGVGLTVGLLGAVAGTILIIKGNLYGYCEYTTAECITSSADLSDVEYIYTLYFNKEPYAQFNSTVGEFVGFNEYGVYQAEYWNSNPAILVQRRAQLDRYCKPNLQVQFSTILSKSVEPKIRLVLEKKSSGGHQDLMMCSAYDFYPPAIDVYWLIEGKKVTSDLVSIEEMADGDWYYQVHSHLEHTPKSGEKISCVVEHISSNKPIIQDWDGVLPESDTSKVAVGVSALVLGIVLPIAGLTVYYRKKLAGQWRYQKEYK